MNSYAISPVPMSDVAGSDFAGRWCTFEWEEDFPIQWSMSSEEWQIILVGFTLTMISSWRQDIFRGNPLPSNVVKKTVEAGVHKIKVELFNVPIKETIVTNKTKDSKEKVPVKFEVYGKGPTPNTAINMVFTSEDGSHSFTFKPEEGRDNKYEYERIVRVLPNTQYKVQAVATGKFTSKVNKFPIELAEPGTNPIGRGRNANNW